jgi:hypothetical protein
MRAIQIVSGVSIVYFLIHCLINTNNEANEEALMAILTMSLVFLIASHLHGIQKNDIADEIRENHKRNSVRNNGANRVQGTSIKATANNAK